jgi:hypothetical protein
MDRLVGSEWSERYAACFRRNAHRLVAWGHEAARRQIRVAHDEYDITGFIVEAIEDILWRDRPRGFRHYDVANEPPVRGEDRTGKSRRRLDIRIVSTELRLRYTFEAKRLWQGRFGLAGYLGVDGLRRYIAGSTYAGQEPEAAMLGYVQDLRIEVWGEELERKMSSCVADLRVSKPLSRCAVVPELQHVWISVHERERSGSVAIFHILLDCPPQDR